MVRLHLNRVNPRYQLIDSVSRGYRRDAPKRKTALPSPVTSISIYYEEIIDRISLISYFGHLFLYAVRKFLQTCS